MEVSLYEPIELSIQGKCFVSKRIIGELGKETTLGGHCLIEVNHKKLYGCFEEGMIRHKDCSIDLEGSMFLDPKNVKSVRR